jgi:RNA polymerase sigma-70 factor, ECF subfamily
MATRITDIKTTVASYAELDDKMLVLDFQAGQPAAFVEIHRRYAPLAKHVCRRFLPNSQDADEAFQETMIRVFQGLFRFNGQFALQPWIARIATNVSLDQLRSRARRPQVDDAGLEHHDQEDDRDTPDQLVERLLERDLVLSVLSDLPESHRRALVLRELEGRSHKEIGEAMGITASQAKALIHRAKGSFRRAWLVKATERGGLMGVGLLPLVWALRAVGGLRRVGEKAVHVGQVAQAATPEIVTTSAAVAAPASTGFAERAVAAGVTLLLAGGVTVGAVTATRDRGPEHAPEVRIAAAAPTTDETDRELLPVRDDVAGPVVADEAIEKPDRGHHETPVVADPAPPTETEAPTPEPTEQPPATESPSPSSEEPSPSPPVAPVPAWTFGFATQTTSTERCVCADTHLVAGRVDGTLPDVTFTESIEGAALDATGAAAWTLSLDATGHATASDGEISVSFLLGGGGKMTAYSGTASLMSAEVATPGPAVYRFSGSYAPTGEVIEGRPTGGSLTISVGIWPDGTIFTGSVTLS